MPRKIELDMQRLTPDGGAEPVAAPTLWAVEHARRRFYRYADATPLVHYHSQRGLGDIWLKLETVLPGGSFKLRGVYNWASHQPEEKRRKGLTTFSAGNTAIALGLVARHFGVPARSYLPDKTEPERIALVQSFGVNTVLVPMVELMERMANAHLDTQNAILHPWHDPLMIAGSATVALEIIAQAKNLQAVYVPVGGGGLAAGVGGILHQCAPTVKIIAVEPEAAPALYESLQAGGPVNITLKPTLCESVTVPLVTPQMFPLLQSVIDEVRLVSEAVVKDTIKELALNQKIVAEGAGALAVAAALRDEATMDGSRVAIVSGGNIEPARLREIIAG
jgi:threonine dehydratase